MAPILANERAPWALVQCLFGACLMLISFNQLVPNHPQSTELLYIIDGTGEQPVVEVLAGEARQVTVVGKVGALAVVGVVVGEVAELAMVELVKGVAAQLAAK